jgi:hypothetical protein
MKTVLIGCVLWTAFSTIASAQPSQSLDSRITDVVSRMASPDWRARNQAFSEMLSIIGEGSQSGVESAGGGILAGFAARHPEQLDRVKLGFINLLKADSAVSTVPTQPSEENGEQFAEAIQIVASFDDERAIPALVGALGTGNMALQGVLRYGQKALGPVLSAFSGNGDVFMRSQAVRAGITILRTHRSPASQAQIRGLLHLAIVGPESPVRSSALFQMDILSGDEQFASALREFVPALRNMAQRDPVALQEPDGHYRYPLRDKAARLLEKLATR